MLGNIGSFVEVTERHGFPTDEKVQQLIVMELHNCEYFKNKY